MASRPETRQQGLHVQGWVGAGIHLAWSYLSPAEGSFSNPLKAVTQVSEGPMLSFHVCPGPWQQGGRDRGGGLATKTGATLAVSEHPLSGRALG